MKRFKQYIAPDRISKLIEEDYAEMESDLLSEGSPMFGMGRWTESSIAHMIKGRVLVGKKITHVLNGEKRVARAVVYHTSSSGIDKLEGTSKSISTRPGFPGYKNLKKIAIQGSSGLLYKLEGDVLIGAESDIMSLPDKNGRRWIHPQTMVNRVLRDKVSMKAVASLHRTFITKQINAAIKEVKADSSLSPETKQEALRMYADIKQTASGDIYTQEINNDYYTVDLEDIATSHDENAVAYVGKQLSVMLGKYIKISQRMLERVMGYIKESLNAAFNGSWESNTEGEVLVNNIKILGIGVYELYNSYNTAMDEIHMQYARQTRKNANANIYALVSDKVDVFPKANTSYRITGFEYAEIPEEDIGWVLQGDLIGINFVEDKSFAQTNNIKF